MEGLFADASVAIISDVTCKRYIRMLSTWDHSTNWFEHVFGGFENGMANLYGKDPEWFLADYGAMIDWCAENGIDAIGIRGLLRDRHHDFWDPKRPARDFGVEEARKVCAYGRERGVRIVLTAGLFRDGGVYYESGNYGPVSDWSLDVFLEKNSDCQARDKSGALLFDCPKAPFGHLRRAIGDPSNPKLQKYALESVGWVLGAVPELGGVQFDCESPAGSCDGFAAQVKATVRAHSSDVWIVSETEPSDLNCLTVGRVRANARWGFGGRDYLALEEIRRDCRMIQDHGVDGFVMEAGASPYRANAEFNYLAFAFFAADSSRTIADFVRERMAPRLGGVGPAERYVALAAGVDDLSKVPACVREIASLAAEAGDVVAKGRWYSLADFLLKPRWEAEMRERDSAMGRAG